MFYTLEWANERAAPEFIRAVNLFPACTITVGQWRQGLRCNGSLKVALPIHLHYCKRALVV